jgi:hypothetical protein
MSDQLVAVAATRTKHNKQIANSHVVSGIRIRDPSNQAVADLLLLRPHCHLDWP